MSALGVSGQQRHDATDAVCDVGQVSALCLLDLTAAFDTVDHQLLLHRLERQFDLRGVVLAWFASYLTDRSFRVLLDGCLLYTSPSPRD